MAERRYGFRFSFAEGCVIVVSLIGASFLVFLFGVYAGRELEAHKAAENTQTVRVHSDPVNNQISAPLSKGIESAVMRGPDQSENISQQPLSETPKTVVVVTPQRQDEQTAVMPVQTPTRVHPGEEASAKTKLLQKTLSISAKKEEKLSPSTDRVAQETKSTPAKTAALARKETTVQGRWSIQVHATREESSARRLASQLRSQGYAPVVSKIMRDGEIWYRVRVGSFANADEARASVERFRREGKFPQAYPVSN